MSVLLTDAMERSTLAAARALIRSGYDVHVVADRSRSLAGLSRGVRQWLVPVDPLKDQRGYTEAVAALASRIGVAGVLPMTDQSMLALLSAWDTASAIRIIAPSLAAYLRASDKATLLELAAEAGFAVPPTLRVERREEIPGAAVLNELLPGFVKPHRSVVTENGRLQKLGVVPVRDAGECLVRLGALPEAAYPVLVQGHVEGPGVGVFALRWGGSLRAVFAHRRIREVPPTGGVSVCRESVHLDQDLIRRTDALLRGLDWEGVAMVECKRELSTGDLNIMEVNGRFWGSLQLALDAGVDFPTLLVECALGEATECHPAPYRDGVRTRWEWGEVDYVYLQAKRARAAGSNGMRAALRSAMEVLRWSRKDRAEIFRSSDPLPFLGETARRLGLLR